MADKQSAEVEVDLATQSNPTAVVQRHLSLDLEADFGVKVLRGRCAVTAVVLDKNKAIRDGAWFETTLPCYLCYLSLSYRYYLI